MWVLMHYHSHLPNKFILLVGFEFHLPFRHQINMINTHTHTTSSRSYHDFFCLFWIYVLWFWYCQRLTSSCAACVFYIHDTNNTKFCTILFQDAKNLVVPGAKRGKQLIRQSRIKKDIEPGQSSSPEVFDYEPMYSRDQR